jgi:aspartyl-tRNA(Asn)/glutamyl-tRNA(Gln) amidotransferase subunit A
MKIDMADALHEHTLASLRTLLVNHDISCQQLTEHFINRVEQYDPAINSVVAKTYDIARKQAKEADALLAKKPHETNLLTGIPIAIKDIFCMKNVATTCCSKMLRDFIAPYDATLLVKLRQNGAIFHVKTNMDEFAMGGSNENSYFGPVINPWHKDHTPGGSSGGSAAVVAARMAPAAIGTDTGGSIRQPASFCGLTGLKPTYGRVSRYGMIAFASSLDQGGPMCQTAEDCAIIMNAISGQDAKDATSVDRDVPDFLAQLNKPINQIRIGLPQEFFTSELNPDVQHSLNQVVATLKDLGVSCTEISLPSSKYAVPTYYIIAPCECSSNLSRFDGVRYGLRCDNPKNIDDLFTRSRAEGFGTEVKRRILLGTFALSSGYYDAYYQKAQMVRQLIKEEYRTIFKTVDLILSPTAPSTAFKLNDKVRDPVSMYLADIFTIPANLAGLPSISVPCGLINGLPVGFQLTAPSFQESLLLNVAHMYQQVTDWHTLYPELYNH